MLVVKGTLKISPILGRLPTVPDRVKEMFPGCAEDQADFLVHIFLLELQVSCLPAELVHKVGFGVFWFPGVECGSCGLSVVFCCANMLSCQNWMCR
jgi:hypothetical protein